jgi:hypothetical protein
VQISCSTGQILLAINLTCILVITEVLATMLSLDMKLKMKCDHVFESPSAVPWLRGLVASLSPHRHKFHPKPLCVGVVVAVAVLGQVLLRVLWFCPVISIPPV